MHPDIMDPEEGKCILNSVLHVKLSQIELSKVIIND